MIFCFLCVSLCIPASAARLSGGDKGAMSTEAAKAVNAFTFDVYCQLSKEKGNLFFSPYSISSALAMTWPGARGKTALEMEKTLRFGFSSPESTHAEMKALRERFVSLPEDAGTH